MKIAQLKSLFVLLSIASLMMACGKKSDDGASVNGRNTRVMQPGPSNLPTGQGSSAGQMGAYINASSPAQMDEAVKILASATLDPNSIGAVRSVEIRGQVGIDPRTGAVVGSNSRLWLSIQDSNVGTLVDGQEILPINIDIGGATGSAVNYTANLTFRDNYGTITITGTYNNQTFNGTVSFVNTAGNGFNGKKSGTLGQFSMATCSFFVCQ